MVAVRFSPKCRQDLLDIGNAPMGYAGREDLAPGLRMAALGRYVIFFRMVDTTVRIERVLHGARNLPAVLEHDSEEAAD